MKVEEWRALPGGVELWAVSGRLGLGPESLYLDLGNYKHALDRFWREMDAAVEAADFKQRFPTIECCK